MSVHLVVGDVKLRVMGQLVCGDRTIDLSADRIGSGGNSDVYACRDAETGERLAVKFSKDRRDSPARFERETELCLSLTHDHVIRGVGRGAVKAKRASGADHELRYFVMEMADGDLMRHLQSQPKLVEGEYIAQFVGLADGLGALHARGVHRDIKPQNILLNEGRWQLADFGLFVPNDQDQEGALTDQDKPAPGPKHWMSPESILESASTSRVTHASDVYQLAAVFWYVVCRRYPLGVVTEADWRGPSYLFPPIIQALQHDPSRRPKDGAEFALTLKDV